MMDNLELEETVGFDDNGRIQWALCRPDGGDVLMELDSSIDPDEQEFIAKSIAAAFPVLDDLASSWTGTSPIVATPSENLERETC